jgi:hypothetical protein
VQLYRQGAHTTAEIAALFGVARSTVYQAVERAAAPPRRWGDGWCALSKPLAATKRGRFLLSTALRASGCGMVQDGVTVCRQMVKASAISGGEYR